LSVPSGRIINCPSTEKFAKHANPNTFAERIDNKENLREATMKFFLKIYLHPAVVRHSAGTIAALPVPAST
jgi:hypothetical protein